MSIGVIIGVHDGIVIGADSASSLGISGAPGAAPSVAKVYNNANKIFNLVKGLPIGCATFGSGSIGNSSIGTLIKDLRKKLTEEPKKLGFDQKNYTMKQVSKIVGDFLEKECANLQNPAASSATNIGLLIGGYSTGKSLGESWSVEIKAGKSTQPTELRKPEEPGISWGGSGEAIQRLVIGFSTQIYEVLASVSGQSPQPTAPEIAQQLDPLLRTRLAAPMAFAPMPIQDAIDLAEFLVHSAIMFSRFIPGAQVVGGPIEIAVITKHEHFKWIYRKHYYDQILNKEPAHVVVDQSNQD